MQLLHLAVIYLGTSTNLTRHQNQTIMHFLKETKQMSEQSAASVPKLTHANMYSGPERVSDRQHR